MTQIISHEIVRYNGVTFDVTGNSEVDAVPVYDSAQRAVVSVTYTFSFKGTVTPDPGQPTTDLKVQALRERLLQPAGEFEYSAVGFGDPFLVNQPGGGGTRDVNWGPKPKRCRIKPLGGAQAMEVDFVIEVNVSNCPDPPGQLGRFLSLNYVVTFSMDAGGYSRRQYNGSMSIPMTRSTVDDRTVQTSADELRREVVAAVPVGFRREVQDFTILEDRRTLKFSITDAQFPGAAPPPGVVRCEANHVVESSKPGLVQWVGTLTATYEMAKGRYRGEAWQIFRKLMRDRLDATRATALVHADRDGNPLGSSVIPMRLRLAEPQLYDRSCASFTVQYSYLADQKTAIQASSLWRVIPDSSEALWAASMAAANVSAPRGHANLRFSPEDDFIVSVCEDAPGMPSLKTGAAAADVGRRVTVAGASDEALFPPPTEERSWLAWRCAVEVEVIDESIELKPLGPTPLRYEEGESVTLPPKQWPPGHRSIIQQRATPSFIVTLAGSAIRAGFEITEPKLVSAGGVKAVPCNREGQVAFKSRTVATGAGVPIVVANWRRRYLLESAPRHRIGTPDNFILGDVKNGTGRSLRTEGLIGGQKG